MSTSRSSGILVVVLLLVAACSDSTTPNSVVTPPATKPRYHFQFLAEHLHYLGTKGSYILWFKYTGDSTYSQHQPLVAFFYGQAPDSMKFEGDITLTHSIDSLTDVLVSVEPDTGAAKPTSPLVYSTWNPGSTLLTTQPTLGGLDRAQAIVTFATQSADTSRAIHEFYLMTLAGGHPAPSAIDIPIAPAGWRYSLWVTDSAFEPKHLFYYGSFRNASGPDDDTTAGDYPYPGGYRPPSLNDPGAQILMTIEPEWRFASRPTAPYPFNILQLHLKRFIHNGEAVAMQNVSATSLPSGYFTLTKK